MPNDPLLDSNIRFLGGIWLGLGLAMLWLLPSIEQQTTLYRILWGMIFFGGIGRLVSIILIGKPPVLFIAVTVIELFGAPVFIYWQHCVGQLFLKDMQNSSITKK